MVAVLFCIQLPWMSPICVMAAGEGTTYYVDANSGSDDNTGTQEDAPWKTLDKVNATTFAPGDRILLKAGSVWQGQLWPRGSGDAEKRINIDRYGEGGNPIINGAGTVDDTVYLYNQEYWSINNLEITNLHPDNNDESKPREQRDQVKRLGVHVVAEDIGEVDYIHISGLNVHHVYGDNAHSGSRNVSDE